MKYECKTCGGVHEGIPSMGADEPWHLGGIPEAERESRVMHCSDACVIDKKDFFIRGVIEIPLVGEEDCFTFGAWVSLARNNFITYMDNLEIADIGPFFGWLCSELDNYSPSTINLQTQVVFRGNQQRPTITVAPTDHPLAIDQHNGITLERAWEIVHHYMK